MRKQELTKAVDATMADFKEILETIYAELNHGQQKKLVKNEKVREIFDRFGVTYSE